MFHIRTEQLAALDQAMLERDLRGITRRLAAQYPEHHKKWSSEEGLALVKDACQASRERAMNTVEQVYLVAKGMLLFGPGILHAPSPHPELTQVLNARKILPADKAYYLAQFFVKTATADHDLSAS